MNIHKIKRYKDFINENVNDDTFDSFDIIVKYDVGYMDIDSKGVILYALQKSLNNGWDNIVKLDKDSFKYKTLNSQIELIQTYSTYGSETFTVKYNEYRDEYDTLDTEENVFNMVKECINSIKYYTYRSVYTMDTKQKADIKILSIHKI